MINWSTSFGRLMQWRELQPQPAIGALLLRPSLSISQRHLLAEETSAARNDCRRPDQKGKPAPVAWNGNRNSFFKDFRELRDIISYLKHLADTHPQLVVLRTIGSSWQGRPLHVLEITSRSSGTPTPEDKPCIFIQAGIHAREWLAPSVVLYIADTLVKHASDARVAKLLDAFLFTFHVVVNPDGYVYSWEVDRMWRKTRSNRSDFSCPAQRDGVAGVDANRNWGFKWGITGDSEYARKLHDPCSSVFIGPQAFSEPEVLAPATYMRQRTLRSWNASVSSASRIGQQQLGASHLRPLPSQRGYVAAFLDFHSFAQALLPPWAVTAKTPEHPDGEYQTRLTAAMVTAFKNASGRVFDAGAAVFPPDPGTGPDWAYGELGVRATMTVELEGYIDGHAYGFCAPASIIHSVGEEQWAGVFTLSEFLLLSGSEPSTLIGTFARGPTRDLETSTASAHSSFWTQSVLFGGGVALVCLIFCALVACQCHSTLTRRRTTTASLGDAADTDEIEFEALSYGRGV